MCHEKDAENRLEKSFVKALKSLWRKLRMKLSKPVEKSVPQPMFAAPKFWEKVDEEVLDLAYAEARKELESQLDAYRQITRVSSVFLGWMVGGIISLSAAVVVLYPEGWNTTLIMAVYALAMLVVPSLIIIFGIQFGQVNYDPGAEPKCLLFDKMCGWLLGQSQGSQSRAFKAAALDNMQGWIDKNRVWNNRRIDCYHWAVWFFIVELIAGIVLFCVLSSAC